MGLATNPFETLDPLDTWSDFLAESSTYGETYEQIFDDAKIGATTDPTPWQWANVVDEFIESASKRLLTRELDPSDVVYEVDFSSLASNAFADGTESIDGKSWTIGNTANADTTSSSTWGIDGSTGIRWLVKASTGTGLTTVTQTAPYLRIPLSTLIPRFDGASSYAFEIYLSAGTFENGNDAVRIGVWMPAGTPTGSSERMRLGDRGNNSAVQTIRALADASTTAYSEAVTDNVLGVRCNVSGTTTVYSGTWSSGWPSSTQVRLHGTTGTTAANPMLDSRGYFVIGFISASDASPTSTVTIARLRVRKVSA